MDEGRVPITRQRSCDFALKMRSIARNFIISTPQLSIGYLEMVSILIIIPSQVKMLVGNLREHLLQPHVQLMPILSSPKPPTILEVYIMHVEA